MIEGRIVNALQETITREVPKKQRKGAAHAHRANGIRRGLAEEVRSLARVPGAAKRAIFDFLMYDEKEEQGLVKSKQVFHDFLAKAPQTRGNLLENEVFLQKFLGLGLLAKVAPAIAKFLTGGLLFGAALVILSSFIIFRREMILKKRVSVSRNE